MKRLVAALLGLILLAGISVLAGGILVLTDGVSPGKDTIAEFCNHRYEIWQLHHPKRRVLVDRQTGETIVDGVEEYRRQADAIVIHTADEIVTVDCQTGVTHRRRVAVE